MKERIFPQGIDCSQYYSPGIKFGNIVLISGQVGEDKDGNILSGIKEQTKQAILNAKAVIEQAGGTLDNVLMCQCFLKDKDDFSGMNEAYAEFFCTDNSIPPARYTVLSPPVDSRYLVEISMMVGLEN